MWIRALSVRHFAGIRSVDLELVAGLNVLHGPNELGKSTLVTAIRAALLLQDGATASQSFVDWHTDQPPQVTLTFETEPQRIWRVRKSFGKGSDGWSYLDFSRDGATFTQDAKGRDVDGKDSGDASVGPGRAGRQGEEEGLRRVVPVDHPAGRAGRRHHRADQGARPGPRRVRASGA